MATSRFLHLRQVVTGAAAEVARESWVMQAERCRTAVERSLPDPGVEVYFNLGSQGRQLLSGDGVGVLSPRAGWVVGPHAGSLLIQKEIVDSDIVGVRLRPGVARQVFGVPASELRDSLVDLEALWGAIVDPIRDRLYTAEPRQRLSIVEDFIAARASRTKWSSDASLACRLSSALAQKPYPSVADVAAAYGLSHRRVIAIFDSHIGLKPKTFHRVERLRKVLYYAHEEHPQSWAQIAHTCAYFDQAHLINDFRALVGMTPTQYVATCSSVGRGFVPYRLASP